MSHLPKDFGFLTVPHKRNEILLIGGHHLKEENIDEYIVKSPVNNQVVSFNSEKAKWISLSNVPISEVHN